MRSSSVVACVEMYTHPRSSNSQIARTRKKKIDNVLPIFLDARSMGFMGDWSIVIIAIALAQVEIDLIIHILIPTIVVLHASIAILLSMVMRLLLLDLLLSRLGFQVDFRSCRLRRSNFICVPTDAISTSTGPKIRSRKCAVGVGGLVDRGRGGDVCCLLHKASCRKPSCSIHGHTYKSAKRSSSKLSGSAIFGTYWLE